MSTQIEAVEGRFLARMLKEPDGNITKAALSQTFGRLSAIERKAIMRSLETQGLVSVFMRAPGKPGPLQTVYALTEQGREAAERRKRGY